MTTPVCPRYAGLRMIEEMLAARHLSSRPCPRRSVSSRPHPGLSDLGRGHRRDRFGTAVKAPTPGCAYRLHPSPTSYRCSRKAEWPKSDYKQSYSIPPKPNAGTSKQPKPFSRKPVKPSMVSCVLGNNIRPIGYKIATVLSCSVLIGVASLLSGQDEAKYKRLSEECLAIGGTFYPGKPSEASKGEARTRPFCDY
jgi:hypothetical protein